MGPVGAAFWWGADLGSGLTTLVTFSGYWLLVAAVLLRGGAIYGAIVLGLYATGRALSVAVVPLLLDRNLPLLPALRGLWQYRPSLHRWHAYGLLGLALGIGMREVIFA
jgi:hypothetical protein